MKKLKYSAMLLGMSIILTTTGCTHKVKNGDELEIAVESLDSNDIEEIKDLGESIGLLSEIAKLKDEKANLKEDISELKAEKKDLLEEISEIEQESFDIDDLYLLDYTILYGVDENVTCTPLYQIAFQKDVGFITETCDYQRNGEESSCFRNVYNTIEKFSDRITIERHFMKDEDSRIIVNIITPKKTVTLDSLEDEDTSIRALYSFATPLFENINQEDYQEIYTRKELVSLVNRMNEGNYFNSSNQMVKPLN